MCGTYPPAPGTMVSEPSALGATIVFPGSGSGSRGYYKILKILRVRYLNVLNLTFNILCGTGMQFFFRPLTKRVQLHFRHFVNS